MTAKPEVSEDAEKVAVLVRAVVHAREQLSEWLTLKVPGLPLDAYKGVRVARGILGTALRDVNAGTVV
jgi:hypothetical protein